MALLVCLDCTAAFAVGVKHCPHCGSERSEEQGTDPYRGGTMPKINPQGEPTFAADLDAEGGEESSQPTTQEAPGGSSETSSGKPETSHETNSTDRPRRARATGSRSKKTAAESSSAGSTATGGPETAATDKD